MLSSNAQMKRLVSDKWLARQAVSYLLDAGIPVELTAQEEGESYQITVPIQHHQALDEAIATLQEGGLADAVCQHPYIGAAATSALACGYQPNRAAIENLAAVLDYVCEGDSDLTDNCDHASRAELLYPPFIERSQLEQIDQVVNDCGLEIDRHYLKKRGYLVTYIVSTRTPSTGLACLLTLESASLTFPMRVSADLLADMRNPANHRESCPAVRDGELPCDCHPRRTAAHAITLNDSVPWQVGLRAFIDRYVFDREPTTESTEMLVSGYGEQSLVPSWISSVESFAANNPDVDEDTHDRVRQLEYGDWVQFGPGWTRVVRHLDLQFSNVEMLCAAAGVDRIPFTCLVWINRVPSFTVTDDGTSGALVFEPVPGRGEQLLATVHAWAKSLPPCYFGAEKTEVPTTLEDVVYTLLRETHAFAVGWQ